MVWPLVAMLAVSAAKAAQDQETERRQRKYNSEVMRYSPWTGMQPGQTKPADAFGTMAQGAATGLAMEQNADKIAADKTPKTINVNDTTAAAGAPGGALPAGVEGYKPIPGASGARRYDQRMNGLALGAGMGGDTAQNGGMMMDGGMYAENPMPFDQAGQPTPVTGAPMRRIPRAGGSWNMMT